MPWNFVLFCFARPCALLAPPSASSRQEGQAEGEAKYLTVIVSSSSNPSSLPISTSLHPYHYHQAFKAPHDQTKELYMPHNGHVPHQPPPLPPSLAHPSPPPPPPHQVFRSPHDHVDARHTQRACLLPTQPIKRTPSVEPMKTRQHP